MAAEQLEACPPVEHPGRAGVHGPVTTFAVQLSLNIRVLLYPDVQGLLLERLLHVHRHEGWRRRRRSHRVVISVHVRLPVTHDQHFRNSLHSDLRRKEYAGAAHIDHECGGHCRILAAGIAFGGVPLVVVAAIISLPRIESASEDAQQPVFWFHFCRPATEARAWSNS